MKKNFITYTITWALLLALFNLITFIIPAMPENDKYTDSFWIGYAFITVMLIGQLVCAAMVFNKDELKNAFYNISLLKIGYSGLIFSIVIGSICMIFSFLPYWVGIVLCAVTLVFNVLCVLRAKTAADTVSEIDDKVKVKTFFIKSLTVDAESLMARADDEAIKAECKKVVEALRYSDPMSNDALSSAEGQITIKFASLSEAVGEKDNEKVSSIAKELLILIDDRNKKCKLLK